MMKDEYSQQGFHFPISLHVFGYHHSSFIQYRVATQAAEEQQAYSYRCFVWNYIIEHMQSSHTYSMVVKAVHCKASAIAVIPSTPILLLLRLKWNEMLSI